ncbi:MAG: hypothetical protein JRL30_28240 [Deltaproteobacteria bacterium]|nr:hypothetical protein [Deltaproteobacteria bacterium]
MNQLFPEITEYGKYKSGDSKLKALCVTFPSGLELYFSYETVIAFRDETGAAITMRENDWSVTTGKHMSWIFPNVPKENRLSGKLFEERLSAMMKFHGLLVPELE